MPTTLLLPGFGGKAQQTVTVTENEGPSYSDPLDCSRCGQIAVQLTDWDDAAELTIQAQQSFDGENFADLGVAVVVVEGDVLRFDITDGPLGLVRFELTAAVSDSSSSSSHNDGTATLTIVGYPVQWSN